MGPKEVSVGIFSIFLYKYNLSPPFWVVQAFISFLFIIFSNYCVQPTEKKNINMCNN